MGEKAKSSDFYGRFREIVSDPLNLLIQKDQRAGFVDGNDVYLHNGLRVPVAGPLAYYGEFSSILKINRGVHEPLEEFVFQEVLKCLPETPLMIELGAYWGHYSMWLKHVRSGAVVHLVEPDLQNFNVGKYNFEQNGFSGDFSQAFVGKNQFKVDTYLEEKEIDRVNVLHADIQSYELQMLDGCSASLAAKCIDYLFISTHSQKLHTEVENRLVNYNYRVEISSDFELGTTSHDGFVFASQPALEPVFKNFNPMSRVQIESATPMQLIDYLSNLLQNLSAMKTTRTA